MSTGADCYFEEDKHGSWTYSIQEYPYGAVEEYEKNGPFSTLEKAKRHLDRNYPNPGGYCVWAHEESK